MDANVDSGKLGVIERRGDIHFLYTILQLAEEHGVKFMETSAKSGLNVETVCPSDRYKYPTVLFSGKIIVILGGAVWVGLFLKYTVETLYISLH